MGEAQNAEEGLVFIDVAQQGNYTPCDWNLPSSSKELLDIVPSLMRIPMLQVKEEVCEIRLVVAAGWIIGV